MFVLCCNACFIQPYALGSPTVLCCAAAVDSIVGCTDIGSLDLTSQLQHKNSMHTKPIQDCPLLALHTSQGIDMH